jgi:hypothetical protein
MPFTIIGIDPGKAGGIAVFPSMELPFTFKMPPTMRDLFDELSSLDQILIHAYLEHLHPMPAPKHDDDSNKRSYTRGTVSAFKSGVGYGALQMALTACDIPYEIVSAAKWQRVIGVTVPKGKTMTATQKKNMHKEKAQQLFPNLKVTHAIADALLIAEYGRRIRTS